MQYGSVRACVLGSGFGGRPEMREGRIFFQLDAIKI